LSPLVTGRGDGGVSDSRDGRRIPKSDPRLEAVGTVDELSCFLGLLRTHMAESWPEKSAQVLEIQRDLYRLNAELATVDVARLAELRLLGPGDVKKLEHWISSLETQVDPPRAFVLPGGGHSASATADVCRAVCRRAERQVLLFLQEQGTADGDTSVLVYLNRLSDYCFVLALFLAKTRDFAV